MYWCLPAALYLLSTFSAACFEILTSGFLRTLIIPNLKKVDRLCNWLHISHQPGWSSSLFGWIAFKELLRISCLFKLRHSCNQPYSTCFPPLLWWTGIWIRYGRRSKEFSMLWPQLIPWVSPHSLISQPLAASFRPLPFNGSFHCSVVHRLTSMDQKKGMCTLVVHMHC